MRNTTVEEFMRPRFTLAASPAGIPALVLPVVAPAQVEAARSNKVKKRLHPHGT